MASISYLARKTIVGRLKDPVYGFNPTLATVCYNLQADGVPILDCEPFEIDFDSNPSNNFFQGDLNIDDIYTTTDSRATVMCVYSQLADNTYSSEIRQKFHAFSGSVHVNVDVHLSWSEAHAKRDFESLTDAVSETMLYVMNRAETQDWPEGFVYNGQINVDPQPITLGAEHWSRLIHSTILVGITQL